MLQTRSLSLKGAGAQAGSAISGTEEEMGKLLEAQWHAKRAVDIRLKAFPEGAAFGARVREASQKLFEDISAEVVKNGGEE